MKKLLFICLVLSLPVLGGNYKIVCVKNTFKSIPEEMIPELEKKVGPYVRNGWYPNGAPFALWDGGGYQNGAQISMLCQCLVTKSLK